MLSDRLDDLIASIAYEAVCKWDGDATATWADAPEATKKAVMDRVHIVLRDPRAGDAMFHTKWVKDMEEEGWTYGRQFSESLRTDPMLTGFDKLPPEMKSRERLFRAIVLSLSHV